MNNVISLEKKRNSPEKQECIAFVEWFSIAFPHTLMFKIQNEGKRNPREAKKIGIVAGMPDYLICAPKYKWHGLFIEMKEPGFNKKYPQNQIDIHTKLIREMYCCQFAKGWDEAREIVLDYFNGHCY